MMKRGHVFLIIFLILIVTLVGFLLIPNYLSKNTYLSPENLLEYKNKSIINDECVRIYGERNPEETLNLFIVPINYPNNSMLYKKPYNLKDNSINFENDVNRLLFSTNETIGYGLLQTEPFASNLDKVSVFIYPKNNYVNGEEELISISTDSRIKLAQECKYYDPKSFVHILFLEKPEGNYFRDYYGVGDLSASISFRNPISVMVFTHELGHQFGAHDTYNIAYNHETIEEYKKDYSNKYESFWEFYAKEKSIREISGEKIDIMPPNCDLEPGCPKWCEGEPLPIGNLNPCAQFNEETCEKENKTSEMIYCKWYPDIHPYFKSQCIPEPMDFNINIGTNCKEGTGCYLGCGGKGFRSRLWGPWIDDEGKLYVYDIPTTDFIGDVFNCCYPTDCNENYNCGEFRSKYEKHGINFYDRYTDCFGCQ